MGGSQNFPSKTPTFLKFAWEVSDCDVLTMTIAEINLLLPKSQILTATDGARYEKSLLRWSNTGMRRAKYIVLPKNSREVSETVRIIISY